MSTDGLLPGTTTAAPSGSTVYDASAQIAALLASDEEQPQAPADSPTPEAEAPDAAPEARAEDEAGETPEAAPDPTAEATPVIRTKDGVAWTADEIERGALRQADYTRKTQALAESRKAHEAEVAAVREERAKYAQTLTQMEAFLAAQAPSTEGLDALRQTDPAEYAARMSDVLRHQQQLATLAQQRQMTERQMAEDQAQQHAAFVAAERDKLLDAVPEWRDREAAQADLTALRAEGLARGFTDAELDSVADHRALLLLRDAMRWRQAEQAKASVKPKIAKAPVLAPGATGTVTPKPGTSEYRQAMDRLRSTGKPQDATRAIEALLNR